jgi:hypothetical protein
LFLSKCLPFKPRQGSKKVKVKSICLQHFYLVFYFGAILQDTQLIRNNFLIFLKEEEIKYPESPSEKE